MMSSSCTPILVGVVSSVLEILLPFKNGQISLLGHGLYSPWSSKNLINQNQLNKFMQIGIDVKFMHTNFSGCGLSGFGDTATFKNGQISPLGHGLYYSPWSSKNSIDRKWLKKFMHVWIDVKFMHTNFGGCGLSGFGDTAIFQKRPNFPFGAWTIVHGHQKI